MQQPLVGLRRISKKLLRADPEAFYSASLPEHVMDEILLWNRYEGGSLRLNTWGGPVGHGRPNSCLNVFSECSNGRLGL